jgi:hypothetical protein
MALQKLKMLISQKYRINMVLDNLPVTAQDLLDKVSSSSSSRISSSHTQQQQHCNNSGWWLQQLQAQQLRHLQLQLGGG